MIGLVVVGFDVFPEAVLIAMQGIVGAQEKIIAVPLHPDEDADEQRQAITTAIDTVDSGQGVLVFTDSMNAPAGYLMLSLLNTLDVEVIGGVNVPMLCKAIEKRGEYSLQELAECARDEGRKAITWRSP